MPSPFRVLLFDDAGRDHLLPLSWTRPCCDFRVGIETLREQWSRTLGLTAEALPPRWLQGVYPVEAATGALLINGRCLPDEPLHKAVLALEPGEGLRTQDHTLLAYRCSAELDAEEGLEAASKPAEADGGMQLATYDGFPRLINRLWDVFGRNGEALLASFTAITAGRQSEALPPSNNVLGDHPVFLEAGADAQGSFFDTREGPIYLGPDSQVMPGCLLRGPIALGTGAVLKMGAKIYGPTTIGPGCKVGGEVNNTVFFANSNKAHDGFIGNAVIGAWANLGADTNNSNLKNDYGTVRVWNAALDQEEDSGLQFCGLFVADHAKAGINTMFNTGTVVGVAANVFGGGFPPKRIPSFSWGGAHGLENYRLDKATEVASRVLDRRGLVFGQAERDLFRFIHRETHDLHGMW